MAGSLALSVRKPRAASNARAAVSRRHRVGGAVSQGDHRGKKDVLENYAKIFESCAEAKVVPVERYGTPERVFDDLEMTFKLIDGKGFPNHPLPVGTRIALRVVHNFHIQDGLIIRENGYEMWRPDISW
jgi:hypothetical protein